MKSLNKIALIILLILTAVCAAVGFSSCGNIEENEEIEYSKGVSILFASDEECPDGNINDDYLKSSMNYELSKTYYIVIDYNYVAKLDSGREDSLCAKISLFPAVNVSATLEEAASGNFSEKVTDDEMNINITYSVPERAGDKKAIRIVVRVKPLEQKAAYLRTSFYLNGNNEEQLESVGTTIFDNLASGLTFTLTSDNSSYSVTSASASISGD